MSTANGARRLIERWRDDPVAFSVEALGVKPWDRQADILRALTRHRRIAVRSGHKVGKSTSAAIISLWWVLTRPRARVVLTSSGDNQIATILWPELRRLHQNARIPVGGDLAVDPRTGLRFPDGRIVFGFSTDKPERAAGQSSDNILYLVDEASGIPEPIIEAMEGNLAGGGSIVLLGNPTQTSGTFYDAFNEKAEFWHGIHISSEDTPNVSAGSIVVPGLATREWVDEKKALWGEDSPLYSVRVRGEFPSQGSNVVIPLSYIEAAKARTCEGEGRLHLGVDVARFGDDSSVVVPRRGWQAAPCRAVHGLDGVQLAAYVLQIARELRRPGEKPLVKVDVIGVGASAFDQLRQSSEVEVVGVDVSTSAHDTTYALLRDQLWFMARDWLRDGGCIPDDPKLHGELVAPTYFFNSSGRIKVEPKDAMKKRLKRSPDRADALALAVYEGSSFDPRTWLAGMVTL